MENMLWAMTAALCFMVLDIITGVVAALKNKAFNSTKMREGIFHKSALIFVMVVAYLLEAFVLHIPELGFAVPLFVPACVLIVIMEVGSTIENIGGIYPELCGSKLLQLFEKTKEK